MVSVMKKKFAARDKSKMNEDELYCSRNQKEQIDVSCVCLANLIVFLFKEKYILI